MHVAQSDTTTSSNGRTYWMTWGALLVITMVMLVLDDAQVSRGLLLIILLVAMSVKATLIAGTFMHLKHEHSGIIWTVIIGLFGLGVILYVLIAPDAARIHDMVKRR